MEREGLVAHAKRGRHGGRTITELGIDEIKDALVMERVGFTAAKVDTLAWKISFDPATQSGLVVLNVSLIPEFCLRAAIHEIIPVFKAGLSMGEYLYLGRSGEQIGEFQIPPGYVAIGTICTVTLNGVLLSARIPTDSRFGGMLEVQNRTPIRFTDVIYYDGTSLDPLEIFIKGGLTSVREAVRTGHGRIGVSFREVPTAAMAEVEKVLRRMDQIGLGGVLMIGRPSQPVLDFPVQEGRTAILLIGGLNPLAAVEEAGMPTTNFALCTLFEFRRLIHYSKAAAQVEAMERKSGSE